MDQKNYFIECPNDDQYTVIIVVVVVVVVVWKWPLSCLILVSLVFSHSNNIGISSRGEFLYCKQFLFRFHLRPRYDRVHQYVLIKCVGEGNITYNSAELSTDNYWFTSDLTFTIYWSK